MGEPSYGMTKRLPGTGFEAAVEAVKAALKTEGFGVLSEIDVTGTLQKKLGVEFRRYVILGACNPPLAHRALTAEPFIGLLLPCNAIVFAEEDGATVSLVDPRATFRIVGNPDLAPIVAEVEGKLRRVLARLGAPGAARENPAEHRP
ncbi:MAG: DUF302 domain-containing protein [Planctomycetota bacterium]